ncbi:MAG TPA: phosphoketolase family protein [Actinomycetes bacterium]|jgi:xylulose-5-phosphate/fructose-6-phosphate phosphoketolase|nr:phosphoketolase family protein [Actinomycetes bacterium]
MASLALQDAGAPTTRALRRYRHAADFLAAAQLYLQDNCLLEESLQAEHLKPRPVGHWDPCPEIDLVSAGLNRLILATDADVMLVTGPAHGAAASLANLWLESSLGQVDPGLGRDRAGLERLVRSFGRQAGFPAHLGPQAPGVVSTGGERGNALATAFGAALDNPGLIVACVIGDAEADAGPTGADWHCSSHLDPTTSGAVLPLLLLGGGHGMPSVLTTMDDSELRRLFEGYGWRLRLVSVSETTGDPDGLLADALEWAYIEIRGLQRDALQGWDRTGPRWPMLAVRTPSRWTGLREPAAVPVDGTWRGLRPPAHDLRHDPAHLAALERWLRAYRPEELFDRHGRPAADVLACCPTGHKRLGMSPHANGGRLRVPLDLPTLEPYAIARRSRGGSGASACQALDGWLWALLDASRDRHDLRIISPDRLGYGDRALHPRTVHSCQGLLQGYLLTGRHGVLICDETTAAAIGGAIGQFADFVGQARELPWRAPVSSLTLLLTSVGWRQGPHGDRHQGADLLNGLLDKRASGVRIYLPPDANTLLVTLERALASTDRVNLVMASRDPLPQWLGLERARVHCDVGASVLQGAGNGGDEPDVVLAAAGTLATVETLAASRLLRADAPDLRFRVVSVTDLLGLELPADHPDGWTAEQFESLFTDDRPVVFSFHGSPSAVHQLVHHRPDPGRFHVKGDHGRGASTTPFDLLVANGASRYHIAIEALLRATRGSGATGDLIAGYQARLLAHHRYVLENGSDLPEVADLTWLDHDMSVRM